MGLIIYSIIGVLWAVFAVHLYIKLKYNIRKSKSTRLTYGVLTFIINFILWPLAIVIARRNKYI